MITGTTRPTRRSAQRIALKAYPVGLRRRIVAAADRKVGSLPAVAAPFGVSTDCVANPLHLRAETGSLHPRPNPGGRAPATPEARQGELRHREVSAG